MKLSKNDINFINNHIDEISENVIVLEGISSADIILKVYQQQEKLKYQEGFKYSVVIEKIKVEDERD